MKVELELDGMSCNHCKMAVNEALASVAGVSTESVEIGRAVITADNWSDVAASVGELLEEEGYPVLSSKEAD